MLQKIPFVSKCCLLLNKTLIIVIKLYMLTFNFNSQYIFDYFQIIKYSNFSWSGNSKFYTKNQRLINYTDFFVP